MDSGLSDQHKEKVMVRYFFGGQYLKSLKKMHSVILLQPLGKCSFRSKYLIEQLARIS